jgi:hypothetical protein
MGWGVEGGTSQIIENGLTLTEKHGNMSSHVLAHECPLREGFQSYESSDICWRIL